MKRLAGLRSWWRRHEVRTEPVDVVEHDHERALCVEAHRVRTARRAGADKLVEDELYEPARVRVDGDLALLAQRRAERRRGVDHQESSRDRTVVAVVDMSMVGLKVAPPILALL